MRGPRLLAAAGIAAMVVVPGGQARAAAAPDSGYWWVAESGAVAVPAPPDVPAHGLYVSSNASGATAVSAVRFSLAADQANPQLVLKVSKLEVADTFAVDAYPVSSAWTPGEAQPWSERPSQDSHAAPVHGVLSADMKTVTFGLSSVLAGGTGNFVLVPSEATPGPTFDAVFEPLDSTSVTTTRVQPTTSTPAAEPTSPAQPIALPPAAAPAVLAPLVPAPTKTAPAAPSVASTPPAVTAQPISPVATGSLTRRTGWSTRDRAILLFLLVDAVLYLGWLGRSRTTAGPRVSIYDLPPAAEAT